MEGIMRGLNPGPVFKYFEEISKIPRGSGNEKAISNYLANFARSRGLDVIQDEAMNILIKKPASPGYESAPTVIIQGHMDMVCDKNKATKHDFEKDPIDMRVEGDMIYAKDTTLGADDGIAIAYGLALLESDNIPHPPLEILMTVEEEIGLNGAAALNMENLKGALLINIDSEEEGTILAGCAGGIRVKHSLPVKWESVNSNLIPYAVSIRGLKGGHSGAEIQKGRGNSNKLMGRVLNGICQEIEYYIAEISGGFKTNAIPREADAVVLVEPKDEEKLVSAIDIWDKTFKNEFKKSDPKVIVVAEKLDRSINRVFSRETMKNAITSLILIPNGVQTMSMDIEGLVESSTNLGIVTTSDAEIAFESAIRSNVRSLKQNILNQAKMAADVVGAELATYSDYPEWEYNPNSKLMGIFERIYEKIYGKKPVVAAVHGGVECGLFKEKKPDLDMVSIGPNMYDVHTPNEHISISSTRRTWELLLEVLKYIAHGQCK